MAMLARFLCPLLMAATCCLAGSVDFVEGVDLGPLGVTARFAVDRQGNILMAGLASRCTLPVVNPLASCGSLWVAKLRADGQQLLFATYLGGTPGGVGNLAGVAADTAGNIVVAADTVQQDWLTAYAIQPGSRGLRNLYLAKLAPDGSQLIYGTYLGGSQIDYAASLAVDDAGAAYVLGSAGSKDFPTTPQSLPRVPNSNSIILKLSADGKTLAYASFVPWIWGGPFYGPPYQTLTVDNSGAVVLWPDFVVLTSPEVWTLSPDGSALNRTPFPYFARYLNPSAFPMPAGGFLLTGSVMNGFLPVTPDAVQPFSGPSPYAKVDGGPPVPVPIPAHVLRSLAVDPENRTSVFAATDGGLFASQDNGWTWNLLYGGASSAIAVDPSDSSRLYLGTDSSGLQLSADGGETWQPLIGPAASSIAADPNIPGLIYAAGGSIFRSTNGGDSWDSQNFSPPGIPGYPHNVSTTVSSVLVDPTNAGWAYAFAYDGCICIGVPLPSMVLRTQDAGTTWKVVASYFPQGPLIGAVDPANGNFYLVEDQKVFVYRGGDFSSKIVLDVPPAKTLAFDPANLGTIYLELADSSVEVSTDDGATWNPLTQLNQGFLAAVGANAVLHLQEPANTQDAYIFLLGQDGTIQYGSYFGGGNLSVNASASSGGQVFVAGVSGPGLPSSPNAFQPLFGGGKQDGFVASFDQTGKLTWATYLGGRGDDTINWVLPMTDGSAVVVGTTTDYTGFPSLQPSPLGSSNTFIAHLRP